MFKLISFYLSFSVAKPIIAKMIEIIQNLITTVDSGQPFFSKWWWIGAILKILFPVNLKETTWIMTEIVLAITGGLFVLEAISVIAQVISFKLTGKRIFKMAPIHHHFEKKGWPESTVVIRFWIISIILAMIGLATLKLR